MRRIFEIVVEIASESEAEMARALARLGFFMVEENRKHPDATIQYKDQIDHANDAD